MVKYTPEQLAKLKAAYASGAMRVRYGDFEVTYQSAHEMAEAISKIERELGIQKQSIRTVTSVYSKGLE